MDNSRVKKEIRSESACGDSHGYVLMLGIEREPRRTVSSVRHHQEVENAILP